MRYMVCLQGSIKIYKWPLRKTPDEASLPFAATAPDPKFGFFQGLPSNEPLGVLVRVYVVKANDLHPMDINGKEIHSTLSNLTTSILWIR